MQNPIDISDDLDRKLGRKQLFYRCPQDIEALWRREHDWRLSWTAEADKFCDKVLWAYPTEVARDRAIRCLPDEYDGHLGFTIRFLPVGKSDKNSVDKIL